MRLTQTYETYKKLGIPLNEQKRLSGVAVDAVFDSVSVATTFKGELDKKRDNILPDLRSYTKAS